MIDNYEGKGFEGGKVGDKTDQVLSYLENNLDIINKAKMINGTPPQGRIEFEPKPKITNTEQWFEYRSAVIQLCQECSTEEITVHATADNATQKFTITITETE